MRFFSAPIGVGNFCIDPVTEQKRLAAGGWIKIEYGLPVMSKIDVDAIPALLQDLRTQGLLHLPGGHVVRFNEKTDLVFLRRETLPFHANGMRFEAFGADGVRLAERVYYSVGGGFVVSDEVARMITGSRTCRARVMGRGSRWPSPRSPTLASSPSWR